MGERDSLRGVSVMIVGEWVRTSRISRGERVEVDEIHLWERGIRYEE